MTEIHLSRACCCGGWGEDFVPRAFFTWATSSCALQASFYVAIEPLFERGLAGQTAGHSAWADGWRPGRTTLFLSAGTNNFVPFFFLARFCLLEAKFRVVYQSFFLLYREI